MITFSISQSGAVFRQRLGFENIQPGAGNLAGPECIDQRRLVDDRAPCRIDQEGRILHHAKCTRIDQPLGLRRTGTSDKHHVGFRQQCFQADPFPTGPPRNRALRTAERSTARIRISNPLASRAYRRPIPPNPTIPAVAPIQIPDRRALPFVRDLVSHGYVQATEQGRRQRPGVFRDLQGRATRWRCSI